MFFSRLKKYKYLLIFITVLISTIIIYHNDSFYKYFRDNIDSRLKKYFNLSLLNLTHTFAKETDLYGSYKSFNKPLLNTDYINLTISDTSISKLNQYLNSKPIKKKWVKATLNIDGEFYESHLKFHGTDDNHYANDKYSYSIKINKGAGFYKNARRFKLIKGEEADPTIFAANYVAENFGLISTFGKMVFLKVNNINKGYYYFVEDIKDEYLKRKFEINNHSILVNVSDWSRKERVQLKTPHISDLDLMGEHLEFNKNNNLQPKAIFTYNLMSENIVKENVDTLINFFDYKYIGKFLAIASIFNDVHFLTGDNLKLIYDFDKNLFYPIYRAEHSWQKLNNELVFQEGRLINTFVDYNKLLFESFPLYRRSKNTRLFKLLLSNNKIRKVRDSVLMEISTNSNDFLEKIRNIHRINDRVMLHSKLSRRKYDIKKKEQMEFISQMLFKSYKYLSYNHIYGSINMKNKTISIINDSFVSIKMVNKSNKKLVSLIPGIKLNENLDLVYKRYVVKINDSIFNPTNYDFINSLNNISVKKNNIHLNYIEKN